MTSYRKLSFAVLAALMLSVLFCMPASAEDPKPVEDPKPLTVENEPTTTVENQPTAVENQPAADAGTDPAPQKAATADPGDGWRGTVAIYGWFSGVHGTVGALGHDAGIHVPFSDLFHYLKGIIPIAVEADKGRFVMPIDYLWLKLGDDKGIPFDDPTQRSINIHLTQSILTPKVGYRLLDAEHFKIDALGGIRYWYVGLNLTLEPSGIGNSRSANWVDGLGGARFIVPFNEKVSILVSGDAGAGGANLDYQVLGMLNFKFTQHFGLGLGWRYLDVNYRPGNHQFVYDVALSGGLVGFDYTFGGKPPVPPSASCSRLTYGDLVGRSGDRHRHRRQLQPETHRDLRLDRQWRQAVEHEHPDRDYRHHRPDAGKLHGKWHCHRSQGEEEQHGDVHGEVHHQAAAASGGKLLGQSGYHRHWRAGHRHHDSQRPAGMAVDL